MFEKAEILFVCIVNTGLAWMAEGAMRAKLPQAGLVAANLQGASLIGASLIGASLHRGQPARGLPDEGQPHRGRTEWDQPGRGRSGRGLLRRQHQVARRLRPESGGGGVLGSFYWVAVLVPSIAEGARRLHDTGRSGWWQLIGLIP